MEFFLKSQSQLFKGVFFGFPNRSQTFLREFAHNGEAFHERESLDEFLMVVF